MLKLSSWLARHKLLTFGLSSGVLFIGGLALLISSQFRCDVIDQFSSESPDGTRRANVRLTACAAVLTTNVQTTIELVADGVSKSESTFFESDGSERPQIGWEGNKRVDVTIPAVATILKAKSKVGDVAVSYRVPPAVLEKARVSMARLKEEASTLEAGRGPARMNEADQKVAAKVYLGTVRQFERFEAWATHVESNRDAL